MKKPERYSICQVNTGNPVVLRMLGKLDRICFPGKMGGDAPIDFEKGFWWLCYHEGHIVGYCGVSQSTWHPTACYLKRVGVLPAHRGKGLQRRMITVRLNQARRHGWKTVITDCTNCNPASANSLINTGFKIFYPKTPWALPYSIYWKREL